MRSFNYSEIKNQKWDSDILGLIAAIYKEAGNVSKHKFSLRCFEKISSNGWIKARRSGEKHMLL